MTDPRWCNPIDTLYELADSEDDGSLINMAGISVTELPLMTLDELYGPCEGWEDD